MPRKLVSKVVEDEEIIVRGLLDPLFWSHRKKRFKKEAFMPPPNRPDVSVLRLLYADDNLCKCHAASLIIPNQSYVGLAVVLPQDIRRINGTIPENDIKVEVICTPIDESKSIVSEEVPVYSDDKGLPMHADIAYSEINNKGEESEIGSPREKIGQISMEICRSAVGQNDPNPSSDKWEGTPLAELIKYKVA